MDALTIDKARRGNRDALSALILANQDVWYRLAVGLLGNSEAARDATQETAMRFLKNIANFNGDSQLRTWSIGIALNVIREHRRQLSLRTPEEYGFIASERRISPSPDHSASLAEHHALLRSLLTDLPDRQREAITLRFFEELSVDDTAAAMNCAPGTIKATVHQALRTLRSKLSKLKGLI